MIEDELDLGAEADDGGLSIEEETLSDDEWNGEEEEEDRAAGVAESEGDEFGELDDEQTGDGVVAEDGDEFPDEQPIADDDDLRADDESPAAASAQQPSNIYSETLGTYDDNVNSEFENRMYRIFSQPSALRSTTWESMVAPHSAGLYRVQRGDTLWDISRTFFGDGNFWPKLWSENSNLTNPHEIVVGKGIAFVGGTEEDAPAVRVTDLRINARPDVALEAIRSGPVYPDDPEAQLSDEDIAAGTVLEEQPIVGGRPELPEPLTQRKPVLRRLPPSFVEPIPPVVARLFDSTGLDVGRRQAVDVAATVHLTTYISDGKPESLGVVDEIQAQERHASYLQYVIVRLDRDANVGERFSALMPRGNVSHRLSRSFGPVVDVGGTVEITETVDAERRAYRAMVIKSILPIEKGALLSEIPLPKVNFSRNSSRSNVEARIIGGEFDTQRKILGPGSVVFIDQGTGAGLQEGQLLAVRSARGARRPDTSYPNYGTPVAVVKIARALDRVSTAVVIDAYSEIVPGDLTGGPFPKPERPLVAVGIHRAENIDAATPEAAESQYVEELDDAEDFESDDFDAEME